MPSTIRRGLFIGAALITLLLTWLPTIRAQTVNYVYDELNRLIRVEYGNGVVIEYEYDKAGNRLGKRIGVSP
jgi:YD repeat-containing protein